MTDDSNDVKDLDSLLDQFETKFLTNRTKYDSNRKISYSKEEVSSCPCTARTETDLDEIEELLKEIQLEGPAGLTRHLPSEFLASKRVSSNKLELNCSEIKCVPAYLSGSYEALSYATPGFEKPCSALQCIQCDFTVQNFDNFCWDASTDYFFLRNNMPFFDKLARKLDKNKGSRAYACQCQCVNIRKLTNLASLPQLKWVCKKHSTETT